MNAWGSKCEGSTVKDRSKGEWTTSPGRFIEADVPPHIPKSSAIQK